MMVQTFTWFGETKISFTHDEYDAEQNNAFDFIKPRSKPAKMFVLAIVRSIHAVMEM